MDQIVTVKKHRRKCAVPQCKSSGITTPNKIFIPLPVNEGNRRKWLKLAGITDDKKDLHFCEDHFDVCNKHLSFYLNRRRKLGDLPNDMVNYTQYCVNGSVNRVYLRVGCMPSKFDCQQNEIKEIKEPIHTPIVRIETEGINSTEKKLQNRFTKTLSKKSNKCNAGTQTEQIYTGSIDLTIDSDDEDLIKVEVEEIDTGDSDYSYYLVK